MLENASNSDSAEEICQATLRAAKVFERLSWYSIHRFGRRDEDEDMTALMNLRKNSTTHAKESNS